MKKILWATLILFIFNGMASGVALAEEYKEGTHYLRVSQQATESGSKIEVLEFFWYGCPHCYQFEPTLGNWIKKKPSNVEFIRVPAIFRPEWKVHARTYYALQVMGQGEKLHGKIFEEIQVNKSRLDSEAAMTKFIADQGVSENEFTDTYNSFSIDNMMRKAIKKIEAYKIRGVPAMAVNGKYVISGSSAGSYENMIRIVNYLISKEATSAGSTSNK
jgi:thiol:disulfide interchange protein DsbA